MGQRKMHSSERQQRVNKPPETHLKNDSHERVAACDTHPNHRPSHSQDAIRRVIASHADGVDYTNPA